MPAKTIGIIAHTGKPGVQELVARLAEGFAREKIEVLVEDKTAAVAGREGGLPIGEVGKRSDLLVVLGGDGTILNAVGRLGPNLKPVFGINIGSLGFLTCLNSASAEEAVAAIASEKISLSSRTLLRVELPGRKEEALIGLNDAVLSRGKFRGWSGCW